MASEHEDEAAYWRVQYEATAKRLAELVYLLRVNPNAYAYDILETWETTT